MSGLRLQKELRQLAERYGYEPRPSRVALAPSTDGPLTLSGIASTPDIDAERVSFAPFCFGIPSPLPPLLYDHDEDQIAGSVDQLRYDANGRLIVRATVTHPAAKRCGAFSVAAHIDEYEIKDADSFSFHAVVSRARLGDISLVETPINPHALVQRRWAALPSTPALSDFYSLMIRRVALLGDLTRMMRQPQAGA